MKISAVQVGCGPVGCSVTKYLLQRNDIELVGAIDSNENLLNLDLGEVAGLSKKIGITISGSIEEILPKYHPDIVFLTTVSSLKSIYPQLQKYAFLGINIITTCEELSYPYRSNPQESYLIDKMAKDNNITILATGVNPGFLMDIWPLFMSGVCQRVERIKVVRVQDAAVRRGPFQTKIGAGIELDDFKKLADTGILKHVGLSQSIAMIADGLKWTLDEITDNIEPVMAKRSVKTQYKDVRIGQVAGIQQIGRGIAAGKELITLEFVAYVGAEESYDALYVTGIPNLETVIKGGVHGDIATAAMIVNSVYRVIDASPGLVTMKDLPIISPGLCI